MNKTRIEWVKNPDGTQGYTWNPITGCLNHTDGLCKGGGFPCYAYRLAHGRLEERYKANKNHAPTLVPGDGIWQIDPFYPRFWPERLTQPLERRWCSGIFVCDMGELFGDWVPSEWQEHVFRIIRECPQHRFYLLTKQPQNLAKFSPFPANCWVGVTMTKPDPLALECLDEVEATVRYLSLEPMLARWPEISFEEIPADWVIIGAQTKPYKPPRIEWVKEIIEAADRAGVKVFLKDNLASSNGVPAELITAGGWDTETHWLRQEMPRGE